MFPFSVISSSNASLNLYPNNTLSKFSHRLPIPLQLNPAKTQFICLKSITFDAKFAASKRGGYIKVHLKELDTRITPANGDAQCLARIPVPVIAEEELENSVWYSFKNPTRLPLADTDELRVLNFVITDEHNSQLILRDFGVTTVLSMVIEEMDFPDHFSITANPRMSMNVFAANTNGDFRVNFPGTVEMDSSWEVALHNIIIPKAVTLTVPAWIRIGKDTKEWDIFGKTGVDVFDQVAQTLMDRSIVMSQDRDKDVLQVWSQERTTLAFSNSICRALLLDDKNTKGYSSWELTADGVVVLRPFKNYLLDTRCDHICIYSDIVQESIMGNEMCKILEVVSSSEIGLTNGATDTIFHVPNLTFRSVSKFSFNSMQFILTGLDGSIPPISEENEGLSITLVFRKKQS